MGGLCDYMVSSLALAKSLTIIIFRGSELPPLPTKTVWRSGETAEVTWQITANHGGGYQYRLCPEGRPLTEECFQVSPK